MEQSFKHSVVVKGKEYLFPTGNDETDMLLLEIIILRGRSGIDIGYSLPSNPYTQPFWQFSPQCHAVPC